MTATLRWHFQTSVYPRNRINRDGNIPPGEILLTDESSSQMDISYGLSTNCDKSVATRLLSAYCLYSEFFGKESLIYIYVIMLTCFFRKRFLIQATILVLMVFRQTVSVHKLEAARLQSAVFSFCTLNIAFRRNVFTTISQTIIFTNAPNNMTGISFSWRHKYRICVY